MNASLYCPLVDAVHYRLIAAQSSLIRHTRNQRGLKRCLSELDTNGENVLHIASKSKASGFARYFLAAHELSSSRGSNNDEFVNVSSKSVFTSSSRENAGALSFGRLNSASAIGAADLVALLRAGVDAGLGVDWLSHRSTGPLESPLLAGCRGGREEVVRILLDGLKQFRVSSVQNIQTDGHWNMTCAHVAAARGHISVLNLLFVQDDAQQMMSWQDVFGRDPAHVACAAGRVEASKLMIQRNYMTPKCKIAAKLIASLQKIWLSFPAQSRGIYPAFTCSARLRALNTQRLLPLLKIHHSSELNRWHMTTPKAPRDVAIRLGVRHNNIRVNINHVDFMENFLSLGRPVVLTGLDGGLINPARTTGKETFLRHHGEYHI